VYEPAAFRPSCHTAGTHGDLYRCGECGTVHQLSAPRGSELHDLYRDMEDERYLWEEEGRRRQARRLLDLLGRYAPRGRLLEIGCGPGLLLDEARGRGYEVEGVELSSGAVRYARERLGLDVREMAFEDAALAGTLGHERYDVVLAVDVLEHLDEPIAALDRMRALLAPGGALLIVTSDPASLVARLLGRRWWCFEPAHICLMPRVTMRRLIRERGLRLEADVRLVHTFTLKYWLVGLSERGGRAGAVIACASARLPRTLMLTASLRDDRVLLARDTGFEGGAHA
jgi:SAM-dependent methyltransferase